MQQVLLAPVRILDASRLRAAGVFDCKVAEIESTIRESINNPTQAMYVASDSKSPQDILAYAGFTSVSLENKNANITLRYARSALREADLEHSETRRNILDALLRLAFFSLQYHRVSLVIPIHDISSERAALSCGMTQEAVLDEALYVDGSFIDAGLFSLLASDYPDYAVAFVPFPRGVISIRGSSDAVEGVRFYSVGDIVDDPFERQVAIRVGTADKSGVILPIGPEAYAKTMPALPEEIQKAVRELREYFAKCRTNFSVNIRFPYGSDFQRHVWQELQRIPYGSTVSYEDIALALTGNDRVAARNLSRAVGSACADNPIPIFVPCHRVIGKDGRLVGFSGGVENKEFLLEHEIFGFFREVSTKGEVECHFYG